MAREEKNGKRRREKGDGSVYPRKNRAGKVIGYVGAYWVTGESGDSGKKKRRTVYAGTRKEAKDLLAAAIAGADEDDGGKPSPATTPKVSEYLHSWLAESRSSLKVLSYSRYELSVRRHLAPAFSDVSLTALSPSHIQSFYQSKLQTGLSPRSVIHLHEALRRALNRAVALGLLATNPCAGVQLPRAPKTIMQPFTREEAVRFLRAVGGSRFEALFVLAVTTGMRRGELLGLRWKDVDFDGAIIRVSRSYVAWSSRGGGDTYVEPKSAGSRRAIDLTPTAVEALSRHEHKMKESGLWGQDRPVFSSESGDTPVNPGNLTSRHFKPILGRAGLPDIRFHDLRHTCATLLLSQGVHPKYVQALLGHATIAMTLDLYSHWMPSMGRQAASAMDDALGSPGEEDARE